MWRGPVYGAHSIRTSYIKQENRSFTNCLTTHPTFRNINRVVSCTKYRHVATDVLIITERNPLILLKMHSVYSICLNVVEE